VQQQTQELITQYAAEGLRTLVLAKADLDEYEYRRWAQRYLDASTSLEDRQGKMMTVAEEIELEFDLVGTTAIEDKLQRGVPQTIELLSKAGIKIWVLTGDKQETAINIGFACSLLHEEMGIFMFDDCTKSNVFTVMQCYVDDARASHEQDLGLVIQGDMLDCILNARNARESEVFLSLATHCRAVICCRVSPLQKAQVVKLVRDNIETVTLSIGDGANDVSMIQEAHVGIGISGLEGLQAARASDFSIAQFRFLQRLLLVHGRYAYRRVSKVTLFSFYKNILLYLTQFWFASMNYWTGQSLYDPWALSLWNMAFSAFPIIFLGVLDRDVESHMLLSTTMFPELYQDGVRSLIFNTRSFWLYQVNALIQSVVLFLLCAFTWDFMMSSDGRAFGLPGSGIATYSCAVFLATFKVALEIQSWTVPNLLSIVFSIIAWYIFLLVYGFMFGWIKFSDFALWAGVPLPVLGQPLYYFTVILVIVVCILREIAWKFWRHYFQQKLVHIVQELSGKARQQNLPFSRKDVVRSSPQLLPKFDTLRPYDPIKGSGDDSAIGEADVNMNVITSVSKKALEAATQALLGSNSRYRPPKKASTKGKKAGDLTHGQPAFSKPGQMNIKDIVLDDILL
jgi:phospholipid-translocating P-type ATPase (flippase)